MNFWRRKKREEELAEELLRHLEMAEQERVERGETKEEAKHAARREFGNVGLVKEIAHEMWGWASLDRVVSDVRFGLRMLLKSPGFTAAGLMSCSCAEENFFSHYRGCISCLLCEPRCLCTFRNGKYFYCWFP